MIASSARQEKVERIRRLFQYSDRKRKKPMTIAAAFCCSDGVVLCADSQITVPDSVKYPESKIRVGNELRCCPFFAFCGDMDYQKQCAAHFLGAITGAEKAHKPIVGALEATALEMHSTYYDVYSNPEDKLNCSMFVSLFIGEKRSVYKVWGPKVSQVERLECMGSGNYLARALANTYWSDGQNMQRTALAASYILSDVKKHVDGCSGESLILCLGDNGSHEFFSQSCFPSIEGIEESYQRWKEMMGTLLMNFQDYSISQIDFECQMMGFSGDIVRLRAMHKEQHDDLEMQRIDASLQAIKEARKHQGEGS